MTEQISHSKEYSVSGLEKFQDCPYQYFTTYSLVLRERPVWDLDPRDRGTLIHSMMGMALRTLENKLSQISDSCALNLSGVICGQSTATEIKLPFFAA